MISVKNIIIVLTSASTFAFSVRPVIFILRGMFLRNLSQKFCINCANITNSHDS